LGIKNGNEKINFTAEVFFWLCGKQKRAIYMPGNVYHNEILSLTFSTKMGWQNKSPITVLKP
jgi:hypothetical protein